MRKKHIAIEILPRALWILEAAILFLAHRYTHWSPILTNNTIFLIIGTLFVAVGAICFIWTLRFLLKPMFTKELVTSGPYRFARHPMYTAIYTTLIGIGLLFFSELWFMILLAFVPIWYLNCRLEENQMTDLYREKYLEYKKNVGMFFPWKR